MDSIRRIRRNKCNPLFRASGHQACEACHASAAASSLRPPQIQSAKSPRAQDIQVRSKNPTNLLCRGNLGYPREISPKPQTLNHLSDPCARSWDHQAPLTSLAKAQIKP